MGKIVKSEIVKNDWNFIKDDKILLKFFKICKIFLIN
jgi:hypothetical protein